MTWRNPLKNIRHTNTVTHVVKNGFVYDAETLDKVHPTKEKQDYPWKQAAPSEQLQGLKIITQIGIIQISSDLIRAGLLNKISLYI